MFRVCCASERIPHLSRSKMASGLGCEGPGLGSFARLSEAGCRGCRGFPTKEATNCVIRPGDCRTRKSKRGRESLQTSWTTWFTESGFENTSKTKLIKQVIIGAAVPLDFASLLLLGFGCFCCLRKFLQSPAPLLALCPTSLQTKNTSCPKSLFCHLQCWADKTDCTLGITRGRPQQQLPGPFAGAAIMLWCKCRSQIGRTRCEPLVRDPLEFLVLEFLVRS